MRQLLLAILFLFAVQPSPAALADTCGNMARSHHGQAAVHNDHHQMPDCCKHDSGKTPKKNCDPQSHCGACVAAAAFIGTAPEAVTITPVHRHLLTAERAPLARFHSPPFRPPIA